MAMSQLRLSAGSPSDTMMESNQLPVQDDDRGEDARPFAKVGDIVQYQGKWRDEIVFGEVRMPGCHRGFRTIRLSVSVHIYHLVPIHVKETL